MKKYIVILFFLAFVESIYSQNEGQFSGDLLTNYNFYNKDTTIGANTTQYLRELSGGEGWAFFNYKIRGFDFSVRFDMYQNSALIEPTKSTSKLGLGFYSVSKTVNEKLHITVGSFYDQFGSGMIFRAYEERLLGLDNAVQGLRVKYDFNDETRLKAFSGYQKNRTALEIMENYPQLIKGINLERDFFIGENTQIFSGQSFVNRTLDNASMDKIVSEINSMDLENRFIPKYNVYSYGAYARVNYKNLSWYGEYVQKSKEAIRNKEGNKLINSGGNVVYTSLEYSRKGFGANIIYKKSDKYNIRTSPYQTGLEGNISYIPPMVKEHSKTLLTRYGVYAKEFGEQAVGFDATITPWKKNTFAINISYIEDENGAKIYDEIYVDYLKKFNSSFKALIGIQKLTYDKLDYQVHLDELVNGKIEEAVIKATTIYTELTYKLSRKKSLRSEIQYMITKQDYGDMFFGLIELNIAPHWSFSLSDMINLTNRKLPELKNFYNASVVYINKATRFTISYVKQVEGVVCTGGVCRLEPAFSGVKIGISTNF